MPRLKKHSQLQTSKEQEELQNDKYNLQTGPQQSIDKRDVSPPLKIKYSDRHRLSVKPKSNRKSRKIKDKEENKVQTQVRNSEDKEDSNINNFLNKYTDDDDVYQVEQNKKPRRKKSQKPPKPQIKIKNKMFSNVDFDETAEQQRQEEYEQLEISNDKKNKKEPGQLLQKFQQKATTFKNKLQYKQMDKDHKYKKNIQHNLKELKQIEEVNIHVEVPKVFAGYRSQVDTALFLKNAGLSTQQVKEQIDKQEKQDQASVCLERKAYYEDLGKKLRMSKKQSMTQSALKERFRKSMLDEKDFIDDLSNINGDTNSRRQCDYSRLIKDNSVSNLQLAKNNETQRRQSKEDKVRKISRNASKESINQKTQKNDQPKRQKTKKQGLEESSQANPIIYKKRQQKQNIKKKIKNFKFSSLIQVQAQQSDDQNQGRIRQSDDVDSDSEDQDSIASMIDDNTVNNKKDRRLLQKKFVADMIEKQQRQYQEIRKKIDRRYIEEQEVIKKRMMEAAKLNKQKDEKQDVLFYADKILEDHVSQLSNSKSTTMKPNQEEKIKELEQFLGHDNKKKQKETHKPDTKVTSNNLESLEKSVFGQTKMGQKVQRRGMKSANVHKKPIMVRGKK